ncbi:hypothetical protein [Novosphingobium lentum]|uniref:hypothetical protein n=1 Tax=Novosphingobium lentum TaxID=145287 RepID=UPI000AD5E56B|nr:hypothetical protein [Novosphingobium lentum]
MDTLDPPERLALAYAPRSVAPLWLGFFALDARLRETARPGREPVMIQLRLAWWRDRFTTPAGDWPRGEPLLAHLVPWETERAALAGMVDGWEAQAVGEDGGGELADARIAAMTALARLCAIADTTAVGSAASDWVRPAAAGPGRTLNRAMRPLMLLRGLAVRAAARGGRPAPIADLAVALRLGLIGR